MATAAQVWPGLDDAAAWLWNLLKKELALYPGRLQTVGRMVLAAVIVMVLVMTFRIPGASLAIYYTLVFSRENPIATLKSAGVTILTFSAGTLYTVIGAMLFVDSPLTHFLWIIGSLFLSFFAIRVMRNYSAGSGFGFLIASTIPLWDSAMPANMHVENTLWIDGAVVVGALVTLAIEYAFMSARPFDDLVEGIDARLKAVEDLLLSYEADQPVSETTHKKLAQFAMIGTARLRRVLVRSNYDLQYRSAMNGVLGLTAQLIDLASNLEHVPVHPSEEERQRMSRAANTIEGIRTSLRLQQVPPIHELEETDQAAIGVPLLSDIEHIIALIPQSFAGSSSLRAFIPSPLDENKAASIFVSDAFSNPEHFQFALKGCLAASLCYIFYTATDWPGISTSVATCIITALSTVGSSRQKQILRMAGAVAGGLVIGIGAQALLMPYMDSIVEFGLLFAAVSFLAAWFATSSPRISYFGLQMALAFYLVEASNFTIQTSLLIPRDRFLGVLLGLLMMWAVFDQIWVVSARQTMMRVFVQNIRLLARLSIQTIAGDKAAAVKKIRVLRDRINGNFSTILTQADAVLLEFGEDRASNLALREQILHIQPSIRALFLTRVALLQFRIQIPVSKLPPPLGEAIVDLDSASAAALDRLADRMENKEVSAAPVDLDPFRKRMERELENFYLSHPEPFYQGRGHAIVSLVHTMLKLTANLDKSIRPLQPS